VNALELLHPVNPTSVASVDSAQLGALSHELATEHGARLADLFGDETADGAVVLRAVYAMDRERRYLILECPLDSDHFPPLSDLDPAAFVEECELYEQFGVRPAGRKRLNRVLVPPHLASTFGTPGRRRHHQVARDYEPHVVSGEAFEFPFGPVRAAGWESLYTGLVTTGEEVLDLYLMQWHKHRGVERRLSGLDLERATFFVERTDGLSTVGHTIAFCRAIETLTETPIPDEAQSTRTVALELERIYNHTASVAAVCQATGLSVGQARVEIVLERLLRLNAAAFGHRYLFGIVLSGGVARGPTAEPIRRELGALLDELREVASGLLGTNSYVDRLEATGIVTPEEAHRLSLVGPVARASGQDVDSRRDHPADSGDEPPPKVATRSDGDVLARMQVMLAEVDEAERLIERRLDSAGPARKPVQPGAGDGFGWAESPRGEALAWVSMTDEGRIRRARLRPASVRNWRAFDDAARAQNVFTDIPIIEASFWLTVAGFAR
jgi:Ni,Fe-hydrogenase III large subunit/NADH:ubiquinone oxidoreductase subunit C